MNPFIKFIYGVLCKIDYLSKTFYKPLNSSRNSPTQKKYFCQQCKKACDVPHFQCNICDVHCHGPVPYQAHLKAKHQVSQTNLGSIGVRNKKNYFCEHCDYTSDVQYFQCNICDVHCHGPVPYQTYLNGITQGTQQAVECDHLL